MLKGRLEERFRFLFFGCLGFRVLGVLGALERQKSLCFLRRHTVDAEVFLGGDMLVELDLNHNDAEALLRHCEEYQPGSGDFREDARLRDALETLAAAIYGAMRAEKVPKARNPSDQCDRAS